MAANHRRNLGGPSVKTPCFLASGPLHLCYHWRLSGLLAVRDKDPAAGQMISAITLTDDLYPGIHDRAMC